MRWNFIFLLSLFGCAMAVASLFGFTEGIELFLWIIIALLAAFILAKQTTHKVFLHGTLSGIAMGIMNAVVIVLWFDVYGAHNPSAISQMNSLPNGLSPQTFILLSSPVIGAVFGIVIGSLSVAAGKFHIPK